MPGVLKDVNPVDLLCRVFVASRTEPGDLNKYYIYKNHEEEASNEANN